MEDKPRCRFGAETVKTFSSVNVNQIKFCCAFENAAAVVLHGSSETVC